MDNGDKNTSEIIGLPGSARADFPCTLISQALSPSPADCEYFYTEVVGSQMHEFCANLDLTTKKGVKGGSWSKKNIPPCYLCNGYKKKQFLERRRGK
jgi:hypothetical protein